MNELYKMLDAYRTEITDKVDRKIIDEKQKELNIVFPDSMIGFYQHFGNDKKVMTSFYVFYDIGNIKIENKALTFGEKHQGIGMIGITLEKLSGNFKSVSWFDYNTKTWYSEGSVHPESFFFHIASWQLINSMDSVARVRISESELNNLLGDKLKLFTDEKIYMKGCNMLSVYAEDVLGCYLKEDEELYLGTQKGDEVLEKLEECLDVDLDWL